MIMSILKIDISKKTLNQIIKKEKIRLILFGETHGFISDETKHIEYLIKTFKPDIILYELLETKKLSTISSKNNFLKNLDNKKFSIISKQGDLKNIIKLDKKYNLTIEGCDLKNMGRRKTIIFNKKLTKKEMIKEEKIIDKREKYHIKFIKKAMSKHNLCFVILGAYHLRKNSPLLKSLNNSIIVYPTYKGKIEFKPDEIKSQDKIIYVAKILDNYKK